MVGSAGNLQVLGNVPDFIPGSQTSTANAWRTSHPGFVQGSLPGTVYSGYGGYGTVQHIPARHTPTDITGPIVDKRAMSYLTKKHKMFGITLPVWAWALAGIVIYRIIK